MFVTPNGKAAYITGGQNVFNDVVDTILEMRCPDGDPALCSFEAINVKLKQPRYGHIAVPIKHELAEKMCR